MGPKKGKRKGKNQDDDEEFDKMEKQVASKWAAALDDVEDVEADPEQLYQKKNKAIFEFDFSKQRQIDLMEMPKKPQRDKYEDFTPEQLEELKRVKEQAKADKKIKNQIKNEKMKERQKELEAQKIIEQAEKDKQLEQKKRVDEEIEKNKKKNQGNPWLIPAVLLGMIVFMFFLQYQKQIYEKLSKFKNNEVDLYEVLEADQSVTQKQLKNKYKKLVLKYHPDRNPDCADCKQKFDKIMKAWEVLGNEEKRKSYDQNAGFISELKSISTTLTPYNYNYLVKETSTLWVIQVFDSTSTYSKYFSQFWEELVINYGDFIKFGRIDIWTQSEMTSYLPYNFKIFPTVYYNDNGYADICSFNFESPTEGIKKCIEEALNRKNQVVVPQLPAESINNDRPQVYFNAKLRANLRLKGFINSLSKYMDFFFVEKEEVVKQATIFFKGQKYLFNLTQNSKQALGKLREYLENFVIQEVSTCAFLNECDEKRCILVVNSTKMAEVTKELPLIKENSKKLPIFSINDAAKEFEEQIGQMKEQFEYFEIGVYEGGRIDLGYANEADLLHPDEGERLNLSCKVTTWRDTVKAIFEAISSIFSS